MEFMYMWGSVSGSAAMRSPKRSSTVHTFSPLGISLCPCESESRRELRLSLELVNSPWSVSWLKPCAPAGRHDNTNSTDRAKISLAFIS